MAEQSATTAPPDGRKRTNSDTSQNDRAPLTSYRSGPTRAIHSNIPNAVEASVALGVASINRSNLIDDDSDEECAVLPPCLVSQSKILSQMERSTMASSTPSLPLLDSKPSAKVTPSQSFQPSANTAPRSHRSAAPNWKRDASYEAKQSRSQTSNRVARMPNRAPKAPPPPPTVAPHRIIIDVDAFMDDSDDETAGVPLSLAPPTVRKLVPLPPPPRATQRTTSVTASFPTASALTETSSMSETLNRRNRLNDEKVPLPPILAPSRSATQRAAISAALDDADFYDHEEHRDTFDYCDYNDVKKKCNSLDVTAELTEDELPAVVTPDLRRQSSTPGAFPAGGSGSGVVAMPSSFPTPTPTTQSRPPSPPSFLPYISTGSSVVSALTHHGPTPGAVTALGDQPSIVDSCTTLVSATLVTAATRGCSYSDCSEGAGGGCAVVSVHGHYACAAGHSRGNGDGDHPILAHAEPIRRKRRIVVCMVAWTVLTIVMVTVSVSLALTYTKYMLGKREASENAAASSSSEPTTALGSVNMTNGGTNGAPLADSAPVARINEDVSNLVVSWGKLSTCHDDRFFFDYDIVLQCGGGTLELINVVNATCQRETLDDANITNPSRVTCRMTSQPTSVSSPLSATTNASLHGNATLNGNSSQQSVLYQEVHATALFSCSGMFKIDRTATVALPDMKVQHCASAANGHRSLQMQTDATDRQRLRSSSFGQSRVLVNATADGTQVFGASAYISMASFCRSENASNWTLFGDSFPCETGSQLTTNRSIDALSGEATNPKNFCYSVQPCRADPNDPDKCKNVGGSNGKDTASTSASCTATDGCSYDLSAIEMSNSDVDCKSKAEDGPTRDLMIQAADDMFTPAVLIDQIIGSPHR